MGDSPTTTDKVPAKVVACLIPGYLRVYIWYGIGMADGGIPYEIPTDLVPFDLRTPNSEFMLVRDQTTGHWLKVERIDAIDNR